MRIASIIGLVVGLALAVWLIADTGTANIAHLLDQATWSGLLAIVAFHALQMLPSAAAWRAVSGPSHPGAPLPQAPGLGGFMMLRWVREGANNLLPVAQVGGDAITARLLARRGPAPPEAIASTICDLTLETATQIVFVVIGLAFLPAGLLGGTTMVAGVALACLLVGTFIVVQVAGGAGLVERLLLRLGAAIGRQEFRHLEGMQAALRRRYRAPGPLLRSAALHLVSWLSGAVEVCLIMHVLGHDIGLQTGLLLESLGQAAKSAGFVIPGGIGAQEGGYAALAAALGLPPGAGLTISLVKRLREVVLGLPALVAWQILEARTAVPVSVRS